MKNHKEDAEEERSEDYRNQRQFGRQRMMIRRETEPQGNDSDLLDEGDSVESGTSESGSAFEEIEEDEDVNDGGEKAKDALFHGRRAETRRLNQRPYQHHEKMSSNEYG